MCFIARRSETCIDTLGSNSFIIQAIFILLIHILKEIVVQSNDAETAIAAVKEIMSARNGRRSSLLSDDIDGLSVGATVIEGQLFPSVGFSDAVGSKLVVGLDVMVGVSDGREDNVGTELTVGNEDTVGDVEGAADAVGIVVTVGEPDGNLDGLGEAEEVALTSTVVGTDEVGKLFGLKEGTTGVLVGLELLNVGVEEVAPEEVLVVVGDNEGTLLILGANVGLAIEGTAELDRVLGDKLGSELGECVGSVGPTLEEANVHGMLGDWLVTGIGLKLES